MKPYLYLSIIAIIAPWSQGPVKWNQMLENKSDEYIDDSSKQRYNYKKSVTVQESNDSHLEWLEI